VIVRIPASTAHIRVVRQAASALAALCDFTYDRLQDLHIAIDEVCSRILATSEPPASRIEFTFEIQDHELTITAHGDTPVREAGQFLTKWSQAILSSVTDGLEIVADGVAEVTFRLGRGVSA
jgi:anti-sigma regulatory factor (Ser/Thr protein kinase)